MGIDDCAHQGLLFTLFSFGVPDQRLLDAVSAARNLIDNWEIGHAVDDLPAVAAAACATAREAGVSLFLTKIRSREDIERGGDKYYHMISHGFTPVDRDQIVRLSGLDGVHGVVFRVDGRTSPWQAAHEAVALCREGGLKASLHIRMTRGNPGDVQGDDAWAAHRIAEALAAAAAHGDVHVYPDTFADVDRGYFRRHGVVDRFFNPRPAYHVVRHLNAALATGLGARNKMYPVADERCVAFGDSEGRRYQLLAGDGLPELDGRPEKNTLIDLLSGERLGAGPAPGDCIGTARSATLSLWMSEA